MMAENRGINWGTHWGMIGHAWAVEMLKGQIQQDALRHAYLFCGPAGVGRRTLALRLAQALNCMQPVAPAEPCGRCRSCKQIERMQYADLAVIQAEKEGGTLKVEPVRLVRQSLVLKPYQGKYRLALFLRFQEANASAANALLKTLEEAPEHVLMILTADTPELLAPTIVSRCEVVRLRPLPVETLETALRQRGIDEAAARLLAHVSGGCPGRALRLSEDRGALDFRLKRLEEMQELFNASRVKRFGYAEKLIGRKRKDGEADERLRETYLVWLSFWRDVLLKVSGSDAPLANVDRLEEIEVLAGRLSLNEARRLVKEGEQAIARLGRNVNARLLTEVLLLDWPRLG